MFTVGEEAGLYLSYGHNLSGGIYIGD